MTGSPGVRGRPGPGAGESSSPGLVVSLPGSCSQIDHRQTDNREIRIKERAVSFLLKYQLKEILGLLIRNECHVRDGGPLFLCIKVLLSVSQEAPA